LIPTTGSSLLPRAPPTTATSTSRSWQTPPETRFEQYDATTVVLPGHVAVVDPWMNLLIRPEEATK